MRNEGGTMMTNEPATIFSNPNTEKQPRPKAMDVRIDVENVDKVSQGTNHNAPGSSDSDEKRKDDINNTYPLFS